MYTRLVPQVVTCFRSGYSLKSLLNDLIAGLVTGIVALPLAIAFAIASGVKPEQGLYTAIVAGFLISLFSGSRVQIGGPTGAFIVIVYGIVQQYGMAGLTVATLMAGVMLVLMGICHLGSVIKYLPYPLIIGFTTGIAVIIAVTQIPSFLGITLENFPGELIGKLAAIGSHLNRIDPFSAGTGLLALLIMIFWPRITRRIPGSLVAILVTTLLVSLCKLPIETIGSRFGGVPDHLPAIVFPSISFELMRGLFAPALTIALLAAIESLLSAVVADGMTGQRHRSNMELVAQGIANIVSPLFGGIPATGAIARTATNVKNGGTTPLAGIIHAVTLMLILLFFGRYAALIPMPALAAILLVVAYNMSEWRFFAKLFSSPRSDVLVLLTVFLLTVFADLTVAIQTGVVLSAFLFMRRMETVTQAGIIRLDDEDEEIAEDPNALSHFCVPEDVEVFEIDGPFFFGAASKFQDEIRKLRMPKLLILRMRHVPAIDATGLRALEEMIDSMSRTGTLLLISGIHKQPAEAMKKAGLIEKIGHDRIHKNIAQAIDHAKNLLAGNSD
ncbi:MAG: sulfate permease, SulP family [Verrucomicrobiota bacterium]|jgi:SulP family sulfate permease|nr:sulfate permease, SulP family [Verrucomicrobiota bacterium]MDK2963132.1 sulfate permease, SulP family [Verrucomicrobiota bacterium]